MLKPKVKSFTSWLMIDRGQQWALPKEIYSRLIVADIKSLAGLKRWANERYPNNYGIRSIVPEIWAKYLEWSER